MQSLRSERIKRLPIKYYEVDDERVEVQAITDFTDSISLFFRREGVKTASRAVSMTRRLDKLLEGDDESLRSFVERDVNKLVRDIDLEINRMIGHWKGVEHAYDLLLAIFNQPKRKQK
jgi:hypothetical protein